MLLTCEPLEDNCDLGTLSHAAAMEMTPERTGLRKGYEPEKQERLTSLALGQKVAGGDKLDAVARASCP
jgi:hypothetical protein